MPTEFLPIATGAANSSDLVVAAGSPLTVALKDAVGPEIEAGAKVTILQRDDAGQYFRIGELRSDVSKRSIVIVGPGTYRLSRDADSIACGVYGG